MSNPAKHIFLFTIKKETATGMGNAVGSLPNINHVKNRPILQWLIFGT